MFFESYNKVRRQIVRNLNKIAHVQESASLFVCAMIYKREEVAQV